MIRVGKLLKNVKITNLDYSVLLKESDKNIFTYLDPPYRNSCLYGENEKLHKDFNHHTFLQRVKNVKHNMLITYDDDSKIRNIYKHYFHVMPYNFYYGTGTRTGYELLIKNYLFKNEYDQRTLSQLFPSKSDFCKEQADNMIGCP